jgi:hypothetical protein
MNRNKILIIVGVMIAILLIIALFWLQNIQGSATSIENSYNIEMKNCTPIAETADLEKEVKAIFAATEVKSKNDGSFLTPLVKINNENAFGIPLHGMNYIKNWIAPEMYVFSDRVIDYDLFFESYARSNDNYKKFNAQAKTGTGKNPNVKIDPNNNTTEFIIARDQKVKSTANNKIWNSLQSLRPYLDSLINKGTITKGTNIKIYYFCGAISGIIKKEPDTVEEPPIIPTPLPPPILKCPENVVIDLLKKTTNLGYINILTWKIRNITPSCKMVLSIYKLKGKILQGKYNLSYDSKEFNISIDDIKKITPKIENVEFYAKLDIYCNSKILTSYESPRFTIDCK